MDDWHRQFSCDRCWCWKEIPDSSTLEWLGSDVEPKWVAHLQELVVYSLILDCGEIFWMFTRYHVLIFMSRSQQNVALLLASLLCFTPVFLWVRLGALQAYQVLVPLRARAAGSVTLLSSAEVESGDGWPRLLRYQGRWCQEVLGKRWLSEDPKFSNLWLIY